MNTQNNPSLGLSIPEIVQRFVALTDAHIFITGKAGTGKTTLLQLIARETHKRFAIAAPTGVAAMNAGGVTLHSFLGIYPHLFVPYGEPPYLKDIKVESPETLHRNLKMNREKIKLLRSLDMLIIDEISMVRCDFLDSIDMILRKFRANPNPFGGVQLVMFGDLFQLPPVTKELEQKILERYYSSSYFFDSKALLKSAFIPIELTKIYRQQDDQFIELLNAVRMGNVSNTQLNRINQQVIQPESPADGVITLSTHVYQAELLNSSRLAAIEQKEWSFKAQIEGEFPEHIYPADLVFRVKIGAQIMCIKNDKDKKFFNGKIGFLYEIDEESGLLGVVFNDEEELVWIGREEWKNMGYSYKQESNSIEEKVKGTFSQFPLRLAWAITIHKSQGLTFDRVRIDAAKAFASGQVYVALSRCRELNGIELLYPISADVMRIDDEILRFHGGMNPQLHSINNLEIQSNKTLVQLIDKSFRLDWLDPEMHASREFILPHLGYLDDENTEKLSCWDDRFQEVKRVVEQYLPLLSNLKQQLLQGELPEEGLQRMIKALTYFTDKLILYWGIPLNQCILVFIEEGLSKTGVKRLQDFELRLKEQLRVFALLQVRLRYVLGEFPFEAIKSNFKAEVDKQMRNFIFLKPFKQVENGGVKRKANKKIKGEKVKTQIITFNLHKEGKSITEIAMERRLTSGTIASHFVFLMKAGLVKPNEILSDETYSSLKSMWSHLNADTPKGIFFQVSSGKFQGWQVTLALARKSFEEVVIATEAMEK